MTIFNGTATITYYNVANNDFIGVSILIESLDGTLSKHFVNFDPHDYKVLGDNQEETFKVNVESSIATYEHSQYVAIEKQVFEDYLKCDDEDCECERY